MNDKNLTLVSDPRSTSTDPGAMSTLQVLLQKRGLKLNPITSLYYISPCCFLFLSLPWAILELPKLMRSPELVVVDPVIMISNAAAAFGLNMSVFLLIGKVSTGLQFGV